MPKIPVLFRILGLYLCISQVLVHLSALLIHLCSLTGGRRGKAVNMVRFNGAHIKSYSFYCHIIFHFKIGVEQMFLDSCIQSVGHRTF